MTSRSCRIVLATVVAVALADHHSKILHPHFVLEKYPYLRFKETALGSLIAETGPSEEDLPKYFDWRNVSGISYVTRTLNQHIPKYCGSCWAHAATSVFGDRLKIRRNAQWPDIELSVQYSLNCLTEAGTCNGGSDLLLFEQMTLHPVPDDTCEVYLAEDEDCTTENQCRNCFGPPGEGICFPQPSYAVYRAKDFGFFEATDHKKIFRGDALLPLEKHRDEAFIKHMKQEIFHRGPISCGVDADVMFDYRRGEILDKPGREVNHVISVAGWDETGDVAYWIMRNSWGTYWGDQGWANVKMGSNVANIESFCAWVIPDWPPEIVVVENATTPFPAEVKREEKPINELFVTA